MIILIKSNAKVMKSSVFMFTLTGHYELPDMVSVLGTLKVESASPAASQSRSYESQR